MERPLPGGERRAGNAPSFTAALFLRSDAARLEQLMSERQLDEDCHAYRRSPNPRHGSIVLFGSHQQQQEQTKHHSYEDQVGEQCRKHGRYLASCFLFNLILIRGFIVTLPMQQIICA
jgi:hypothetical protein